MKLLFFIFIFTCFLFGGVVGDCRNNCSFHGSCINTISNATVCACNFGYTKDDCSYQEKSKLLAFLLSFLLGGL